MIEISNMRTNSLGTASFDMKIQGWRKPQEFSVYPIPPGSTDNTILIQSDKRFGRINFELGTMVISQNHKISCNLHLTMDIYLGKAERYHFPEEQLSELTKHIQGTSSPKAGKNGMGVFTDNSGASNLMSL